MSLGDIWRMKTAEYLVENGPDPQATISRLERVPKSIGILIVPPPEHAELTELSEAILSLYDLDN